MIIYVESEIPQEEQIYQGWFWHEENKTFVRWSDFTGFNNRSMTKRDTRDYVESELAPEKHEYSGWFWDLATKKFYRWNDFPGRKYGIRNGNS